MYNTGAVLANIGIELPAAILFMNSNKSERNIRKKVARIRENCMSYGIVLGHDVVVSKGPDRDIDRAAINTLILLLLDGKYQMIAVNKLTDITADISDLETFLNDAAAIGVSVLELSSMQIRRCVSFDEYMECASMDNTVKLWL